MMDTIQTGSYGGTITTENDGTFFVCFLINMGDPTHSHSTGDISRGNPPKYYKTRAMAEKKIVAFIKKAAS